MNKLIAITGGIGSGKSTVSKIIRDLGFTVLSCDDVYAELLERESFVKDVSLLVGVAPLIEKGRLVLNRRGIADKVFTDASLKKSLEEFTHPAIMNEIFSRAALANEPVFVEVPLLFETGLDARFDNVIIVKRPLNQRLSAVCLRDGVDEEAVKRKIKNQFDYENNCLNGHTVIYNDFDLKSLQRKTEAAINEIFKQTGI